jgi:hypothetical protein
MSAKTNAVSKLWCIECGKNFIHYVGGIPQQICSYCAGQDVENGDE